MIPPSEAPVCTDPKLFVGGLAFEIDREAVATHFGQYGPLRDCALLKHADGKSKGCAMVLYNSWAHAEAAIASENGAMNHLSGPRQLIVKFADPQRRPEDGVVVGVIPRKLFVGQVACCVHRVQCVRLFFTFLCGCDVVCCSSTGCQLWSFL